MKKIIALLMLFAVSGCQSHANFVKVMDTLKGHTAKELVANWGYPDGSFKSPDGNDVYVYSKTSTVNVPQNSYSTTNGAVYGNTINATTNTYTTGGYNLSFSCTVYVEIGQDKIIKEVTWKGDNCVA